jgi:sugar phosphate isomerase/epimerase
MRTGSKIFVQPVDEDFEEYLEYAETNGFNLEIASFAFADVLDGNWQKLVNKYKDRLRGFKGLISIHAAFQDLLLHSRDKKVSGVAKERFHLNLKIAKELDAQYVVFHTNLNPLIRHKSYLENWVKQNALFWTEALSEYDVIILFENLWEPNPELMARLLQKINSPRFKICFDTGHWNIFSEVSMRDWFSVLGENIAYIHVNDNKKDMDNELVPGEGNVNWQEFSDLIEEKKLKPEIVFEVGALEKAKKALAYFEKNKIYPF